MKGFLKLLQLHSDYERLFFLNEYKTLLGKNSRIIGFLIVILFLTFLALGYSIGSIQYLEKRMSNPYTNWVDLTVAKSMGITDEVVEELLFEFPDEKKQKFHIKDIRGSIGFRPDFYQSEFSPSDHPRDTLFRTLKAITVDTDDLLFEKIISKENAIWVNPGLAYNCDDCLQSCEVIVTEKGMSLLSHDPTNSNLSHIFVKDGSGVVPVEVVAVVKTLPKFYEMACSIEFFNIIDSNEGEEYIDHFNDGDNACKFLIDPGVSEAQVDSMGQSYFERVVETEIQETLISGDDKWQQGIVYFSSTNAPSLKAIEDFIVFSRKNGVHLGLMAEYSCTAGKLDRLPLVHNIAFNFTDLNEIRAFKEDMAKDGIEIDTKQIEVKENFALVSSLTWTISVILLAFGVLSIILFVNNLLRTHLFKVRTNLGTFKAFGLSNSFLNTIYLKIISVFLLIAIFIAFLLAGIVDLFEHLIYEESKFNIISPWVLVAIILLVGVSLFISFRTSKKILGDTPGNLIYNR
jgi:hypothetical protein